MSRPGIFRTCRTLAGALAVLLALWSPLAGTARAGIAQAGTPPEDREPLRLRSLRDETARTVLDLFGPPSEVPPRATLASRDHLDLLCPEGERLVAWLVSPGSAELPLQDFAPSLGEYLPGELLRALSGARGFIAAYGVAPAPGSSPAGDSPRELLLFYRSGAFRVLLYREEGLFVDGEVIPREWSRRRSLATGQGY